MTKTAIPILIIILTFNAALLQGQSVVTKEPLVNAKMNSSGELVISPSKASSQSDFDFFEGKWKIQHRKLKMRLNNCTEWIEYEGTNEDVKMLNGIGHTNNNKAAIDGMPVEGVSLTLFNPKTRLWSIYWASSKDGVLSSNPIVGSFEGNLGKFYSKEILNGKSVIVMAQWDKTDPNKAIWSQAYSDDNGKTWEWNWYMTQTRVVENKEDSGRNSPAIDNAPEVPMLNFDTNDELIITASSTSSQKDFDFFVGKWRVHNRTLKKNLEGNFEWKEFESTQEMHTVLNGLGNIDNYLAIRNGKPFEGMTLRLFNPQTKLWSIYWADSNYGVLGLPPVTGSFENKVGHFFSKDIYNNKDLITVYRWDARDPDRPIWSQASSEDKGKTWEWNWFMTETRVVESEDASRRKLLTFDTTIEIPKLSFDGNGELLIMPSATSSQHDFECLTGKWKMYHRRLKSRLSNNNEWIDLESMDENYGAILNGIGNTDLYKAEFDGKPFEGFTLRLFNPQTKLWSLYWVASNSGVLDPPVVGSFENDIGHFFCKDTFNGQKIIVLFRWDKRDKDHPVWSQAFSPDNGNTWEWNWINASYRVK